MPLSESDAKNYVAQWVQQFVPDLIARGGDEQDLLAITEQLIVGTLFVGREVFRLEPERVFERMKTRIDQRLADMEGERLRKERSGIIVP